MKRFIIKITTLFVLLIAINLVLILAIPKDNNHYLCEYNHKVELIEKNPQPRIILVGGSSIAFGTNSKTIEDSLYYHVINFGLHAGIGIKYPLEDCLQMIQQGDIVVLQIEYENFFNGGNGEPETLLPLMIATDWRHATSLNFSQWQNIILGGVQVSIRNLKRLVNYPFIKSWDSSIINEKFEYVKSGFNEYGDEVSHFKYPDTSVEPLGTIETRNVDNDFMTWLADIIGDYQKAGAIVLMMPPVCPATYFHEAFNKNIEEALHDIHQPYIVSPASMVLDDSCAFNGGYHVNEEGVRQNTAHMIDVLRKYLTSVQ